MEAVVEKNIDIPDIETEMNLFGQYDKNIRLIENALNVKVTNRENEVKISGVESKVDKALEVIYRLLEIIKQGETITTQNVNYLLSVIEEDVEEDDSSPLGLVCITARGKPIKSKTYGQKYVEAIKK